MVPDKVKAYYISRHRLTVSDGLVLYNDRRVVPQKVKSEILQRVHDWHQGTVREWAKCSVWRPVSKCKVCQEYKLMQKT